MAKSLKLAISSAKGRGDTSAAASIEPQSDRRTGRYTDPSYQTLSVKIPRELHRKVKAAAATEGREMSGFVEDILRAFVASHS